MKRVLIKTLYLMVSGLRKRPCSFQSLRILLTNGMSSSNVQRELVTLLRTESETVIAKLKIEFDLIYPTNSDVEKSRILKETKAYKYWLKKRRRDKWRKFRSGKKRREIGISSTNVKPIIRFDCNKTLVKETKEVNSVPLVKNDSLITVNRVRRKKSKSYADALRNNSGDVEMEQIKRTEERRHVEETDVMELYNELLKDDQEIKDCLQPVRISNSSLRDIDLPSYTESEKSTDNISDISNLSFDTQDLNLVDILCDLGNYTTDSIPANVVQRSVAEPTPRIKTTYEGRLEG